MDNLSYPSNTPKAMPDGVFAVARGQGRNILTVVTGLLAFIPRLVSDPGSPGMASKRQPLMAHCEWPPGAP
jgi:hypothetical protein